MPETQCPFISLTYYPQFTACSSLGQRAIPSEPSSPDPNRQKDKGAQGRHRQYVCAFVCLVRCVGCVCVSSGRQFRALLGPHDIRRKNLTLYKLAVCGRKRLGFICIHIQTCEHICLPGPCCHAAEGNAEVSLGFCPHSQACGEQSLQETRPGGNEHPLHFVHSHLRCL